jgi:hypothetical protein
LLGQRGLDYKILEKLGAGSMSSFGKKYNRLIPLAGGVVFTP